MLSLCNHVTSEDLLLAAYYLELIARYATDIVVKKHLDSIWLLVRLVKISVKKLVKMLLVSIF